MIRIEELKLDLKYTEEDLKNSILKILGIGTDELLSYRIHRRSVDAREKGRLHYVFTIDAEVKKESRILRRASHLRHVEVPKYHFPKQGELPLKKRPVIIGSGPAGLLAAYELALHGFRPIILERGREVDARKAALDRFFETGQLDPMANAQFGEGGAGTFSDGKLNTSVTDREGRNREVLELFVKMGAPEEILYEAKPHVGTDRLIPLLRSLRKRILELGGTYSFEAQVTDLLLRDGRLQGVMLKDGQVVETEVAVLAIGHSARDTYRMLFEKGIAMEQKAFAVGFRVEHPQEMIDVLQYGFSEHTLLPAAPYKLTCRTDTGRGVYSFCMCPGGYVLNASSSEGMLCVNGMSYSDRAGKNANSAIVLQVLPGDVGGKDVLSGALYQERLEKAAFRLAAGRIPQQLFQDFKENRLSTGFGAYESACRGQSAFANLRELFSEEMTADFLKGMESFGRKIPGFDREDVILSGIESRTSSPVRILRDAFYESSLKGLYPAGEGAGYAGGIMSAAMDGIRTAEEIAKKYKVELIR